MAARGAALSDEAFVWAWLPGATTPVVAGVVERTSAGLSFTYAESYLARAEVIPLYSPELPLRQGIIDPGPGLRFAGSLRDAAPDAWGQRIILARRSESGLAIDPDDVLTFMLDSGSDRIGALDFQPDPREYRGRGDPADLDELISAGSRFAEGEVFSEALAAALMHGTSVGGARPKALLSTREPGQPARHVIAKFSLTSDPYPVVKAEAVAMSLARRVGLNVAGTSLIQRVGRDVLLVDRFDRPGTIGSVAGIEGERRLVVSALTLLGLGEEFGRYATYPAIADQIRRRFNDPAATLRELFSRLVFSILISNTDDHARNHAAFWDGNALTLTPAYDLSPQARSGDTAAQAMAMTRDGARASRLAVAKRAAGDVFNLSDDDAAATIDEQVTIIREQWAEAADEALLTAADRQLLWERLILNPAVFYPEDAAFDAIGP